MGHTYKRKIFYYETDKMGITHHANYIHLMEESRIDFLDSLGLSFKTLEDMGIASPVVSIQVDYKCPSTFDDEIEVEVGIVKYTGVKLEVAYTMRKNPGGIIVAEAVSTHCFLVDGQLTSLRKKFPEVDRIIQEAMMEESRNRLK